MEVRREIAEPGTDLLALIMNERLDHQQQTLERIESKFDRFLK